MTQAYQRRQINLRACSWKVVVICLIGTLCSAWMVGCSSIPEKVERVPIDQLMQEAINQSARLRAEQELVAEGMSRTNQVGYYEEELGIVHAGPELIPSPIAALDEGIQDAFSNNSSTISETAGSINEEFFETDIREAISIVAAEGGADVLVDDRVQGVVNVSINEATVDQALEKLLLPLGFVMGKRGNQYVICPADAKSPLFPFVSQQVEYRPKYQSAKSLMAAPPRQMTGFVRLVEDSNMLVIEAPNQYMPTILERIRRLDQPVPQVELEAIVCVVSPDSGFRFGLDWEHAVELDGETAFQIGASGLALSGSTSPNGFENMFSDFATTSAFVKMLADNGYLTIRAAPRVMAQDGEEADITIGRETFFAIQPPGTTGDNSTLFYQPDVQKVEAGISLQITPYIRDNAVTVDIEKAEVSEDIRSAGSEVALNPYPIINRRSVSTTVNVADGKTIIIGGLVQRETVERINRVPGLSQIPGVGYLFQSVEKQSREAEVVIFISPRIVRPGHCNTCSSTPCLSERHIR